MLAVDEKPSIQALERAQGYLRLPDGKAVKSFSHGYQRHGTNTLFAALESSATGEDRALQTSSSARVFRFHEQECGRIPRPGNPRRVRQPKHPQAERRSLAETAFRGPVPLHSDLFVLAQPSGGLVQYYQPTSPPWRQIHLARSVAASHRRFHQGLQQQGGPLRVEEGYRILFGS